VIRRGRSCCAPLATTLTAPTINHEESEMTMSDESAEAMKKAAEEGAAFISNQQAQYAAEQAAEAARVAGLPDDQLPEGTYATKEEAIAYLDEARAAGKYPQPIDDGTGNGDYTIEISSPYKGYETVWITAVSDTDPNPPLNVDIQPA
jgi:hypothetical protein